MGNVRFILKDTKKINTMIVLYYRFDGKRLVFSTGQKCDVTFWDFDKQRVKQTKKYPVHIEINAFLEKLKYEAISCRTRFLNKGVSPEPDDLRQYLLQYVTLKRDRKSKDVLYYFDKYIKEKENSVKYAKGTTKMDRGAFNHLSNFLSERNKRLSFNGITLDFFYEFINWLYAPPRSHSINHVHKIIKRVKSFLNDATERGFNHNLAYKNKKFSISTKPTDKIYLTTTELSKMYKIDLSGNTRLERVRDLFLIGCFTGLRFSDFIRIKKEYFREVQNTLLLELTTAKTDHRVVIPVHPIVKEIIFKYHWNLPRVISSQKMNDYIKEVGEIAGLCDPVIVTSYPGGIKKETISRKYELITTHTARRSFATNARIAGIGESEIIKIMGLKSRQIFGIYNRISNEDNALIVARNAFFK